MSTPISAPVKGILDRLQNVRPNGNGRTALCPAHDDRNNSLSVGEGSDGRVLLKCFAGCDASEIVTALGQNGPNCIADGLGVSAEPTVGCTASGGDADALSSYLHNHVSQAFRERLAV